MYICYHFLEWRFIIMATGSIKQLRNNIRFERWKIYSRPTIINLITGKLVYVLNILYIVINVNTEEHLLIIFIFNWNKYLLWNNI